MYLVATAKGADTGAYALGRLAGRHKLWPSLSPKKTVEGAIGGLILAAWHLHSWSRRSPATCSRSRRSTGPQAAVYGLVVGAVAQLGDLMESMIKRDCERKDASAAVPGLRRRSRRDRFADLRRPRRLWFLALVRPLGSELIRELLNDHLYANVPKTSAIDEQLGRN